MLYPNLWSYAGKQKSWSLWSRKSDDGLLWQATHGKRPVTEKGFSLAQITDQIDYYEATRAYF